MREIMARARVRGRTDSYDVAGPSGRPELAQLFQSGAIGNHDEAIADSQAALALPRAQVLVHALARRSDDIAEFPLRKVDSLDGMAVDDQSVRGRQSQQGFGEPHRQGRQ